MQHLRTKKHRINAKRPIVNSYIEELINTRHYWCKIKEKNDA